MKFAWADQHGNIYPGLPVEWWNEEGKIFVGVPGNSEVKIYALYELRELVIDPAVKKIEYAN